MSTNVINILMKFQLHQLLFWKQLLILMEIMVNSEPGLLSAFSFILLLEGLLQKWLWLSAKCLYKFFSRYFYAYVQDKSICMLKWNCLFPGISSSISSIQWREGLDSLILLFISHKISSLTNIVSDELLSEVSIHICPVG